MSEDVTSQALVDEALIALSKIPHRLILEGYRWTERERVLWDKAYSNMNQFRESVWGEHNE